MTDAQITKDLLSISIKAVNAVPFISGGWAYDCCGEIYVVSTKDMLELGIRLTENGTLSTADVVERWECDCNGDELHGPFPITLNG